MQVIGKRKQNTMLETLQLFAEHRELTTSDIEDLLGRDFSTAYRRVKDLRDAKLITPCGEANGAGGVGAGASVYRITLLGVAVYLLRCAEDGVTGVDRMAELHPETSLMLRHLDHFKQHGHDLREDILDALHRRLAQVTSTINLFGPYLNKDEYITDYDLTVSVLWFNNIFLSPETVDHDVGPSVDECIGLWRVADMIPKLRELRFKHRRAAEEYARRFLQDLEEWRDRGAF